MTSGVCRAVGACLGGGGRPASLSPAVVNACYERINRIRTRFLALMERVRTGRQRGGWLRVAPVLVGGGLPRASVRTGVSLPRRFGWLVHLGGYQAAGPGSQLSHLLMEPEMVALVRDVPQARRILSPLCRMLGVDCAGLRAVPRVRRVRKVVAVAAGVGGLVPKRVVEPWRTPLPQGVLAAARRAGYGKIPKV